MTMRITFWGTRGSVPVSGPDFAKHGGATTCVGVELLDADAASPRHVIIDCGTGLVDLGRRRAAQLGDLLVLQTHFHWDHLQGFPFFSPLYDPTTRARLRGVPREGVCFESVLDEQMTQPNFPIGLGDLRAALDFGDLSPEGQAVEGRLAMAWTEVCHPGGCTAYRLEYGGRVFVFSGDNEVRMGGREALVELARDADLLVMDAQYMPEEYEARRGFGHSTPLDAVDVALEAGVDRLLMTHHDPCHDDARLEQKLAHARDRAAGRLRVGNAFDGLSVDLTPRDSTARVAIA